MVYTVSRHFCNLGCTTDFRISMTNTLRWSLLFVLTGREYSRMARKRITMVRMISPMKRHLNLRHTMNFMVLHGLVNQKKDVSGRLTVMENKRGKAYLLDDIIQVLTVRLHFSLFIPTIHLKMHFVLSTFNQQNVK